MKYSGNFPSLYNSMNYYKEQNKLQARQIRSKKELIK